MSIQLSLIKSSLSLSLAASFLLFVNPASAQVDTASLGSAPATAPSATDPSAAATAAGPAAISAAERPITPADCGDALSEALHSDTQTMPCWANIRAVDRWNTTQIPDAGGIQGASSFSLPREQASAFSLVLGGLAGTDLSDTPEPRGYGGVTSLDGFIDHRRWQMMFVDAGALADYRVAGDNNLAGMNRLAIRGVGELTPRLMWQASATNTYGTDALRLFAPLDYRSLGKAEAPVADTVAYGLHTGRLTDEQEDLKFRYESSRRSNWDFAAGHTLQSYEDDGVLVQTVRFRGEFLHALSPNTALGVYGNAESQEGSGPCSFAGGGLRSLSTWGTRATLNISGGLSAAEAHCGKRVEGTGDVALSLRAGDRSWLFFSANRSLSDGIVERTAFLNSAVVGIRHSFTRLVDVNLSGAGILGNDVLTHQEITGTFSDLSISYPVGPHLIQETSVRHFQVNPTATGDSRTLLTFTLWFNPKRKSGAS